MTIPCVSNHLGRRIEVVRTEVLTMSCQYHDSPSWNKLIVYAKTARGNNTRIEEWRSQAQCLLNYCIEEGQVTENLQG